MKIVSLVAENIKKLKAVEIKPTGEIVTIAGKNGAGKTSVLDSIWWALAGTAHIQAQPIRKGQNKARIKLDLGELIVERKFTDTGSTLTVENAEGARFPSPQKMLDALLGALSFDPLAFSRMEPKKQFDELRRISSLEIDVEQLDGLNAADYGKRTDVNREAKAKKAQADGITVPTDLPAEPIDESALIDEIQKAGEHNASIEAIKAEVQRKIDLALKFEADAVDLETEAARLREEANSAEQLAIQKRKMADDWNREAITTKAPAPINVTLIRDKLNDARGLNAQIAKRTQRATILQDVAELEKKSKDLTEQIAARTKTKQDAIAAAKMPIDGMGFGEGCVTYNGIPFDQSSSAEQLRVSLAIAMAANPKLKVIRITDGSLLDDDSMSAIEAIAKGEQYQVWIERVDSSGKVGIVIDDGMVVAVDGEKVEG